MVATDVGNGVIGRMAICAVMMFTIQLHSARCSTLMRRVISSSTQHSSPTSSRASSVARRATTPAPCVLTVLPAPSTIRSLTAAAGWRGTCRTTVAVIVGLSTSTRRRPGASPHAVEHLLRTIYHQGTRRLNSVPPTSCSTPEEFKPICSTALCTYYAQPTD